MQLEHDDKETTWESHGFVRIKDESGSIVVESADFQHNRCFSQQDKRIPELLSSLEAKQA